MMGRIRLSDKSRGRHFPRAVFNRFLHCLARYVPMFPGMRVALHRLRGVHIGRKVFIGAEVFIDDAEPDLVVIEDDVTVIARASILAHGYYPEHLRDQLADAQRRRGVTIKRGAYLGFGAIVLPGVTIGEEAIIGAAAIVARDVPQRAVVLGPGARIVRRFGPGASAAKDEYENHSRGGCAAPDEQGKEGERGISPADMASEPDAAMRSAPPADGREGFHTRSKDEGR